MRAITPFLVAVLAASALTLSACARTGPVRNVSDVPIAASEDLTQKDIRTAIIRAGSSRGWRMDPQGEGHILAVLNIRDHVAKVDIYFNESSYDIVYRDSENLNYDSEKETIHSNYNGWIQNLELDINNYLAAM